MPNAVAASGDCQPLNRSTQRLRFSVQGAWANPAVPRDGEAGRVSSEGSPNQQVAIPTVDQRPGGFFSLLVQKITDEVVGGHLGWSHQSEDWRMATDYFFVAVASTIFMSKAPGD